MFRLNDDMKRKMIELEEIKEEVSVFLYLKSFIYPTSAMCSLVEYSINHRLPLQTTWSSITNPPVTIYDKIDLDIVVFLLVFSFTMQSKL